MRLHFILAAACVLAPPAAAQELGERTQAPQSMLGGLSLAPGQDDLSEAVAAAQAHPLGSLRNPVRVGGPEGERAYLARLRCADGSAPEVGERAEAGVGAFGTVVAGYALSCNGTSATIVFDMYHAEHVENRAPAGFTVAPH